MFVKNVGLCEDTVIHIWNLAVAEAVEEFSFSIVLSLFLSQQPDKGISVGLFLGSPSSSTEPADSSVTAVLS